ncbi:eukaryotic translation initiation factor 2A-like, partial [Teleopsis dalmanni]|uniref:eukaryotic translation initiation factor 2A-like n=1 Tax=Teleopsis dalmanni TaxID=139649 RepID=UPI0018CD93A2
WSPKANEFVVVYGFMPSKAALYNLKCDVVFDFGEGPRNCAYFNAFGNLVVLAGFGNLPGNVEIWDVQKREKLVNIKCPDTTQFEWNPNGEYFITATTSPRLRIGNGFKVYHYSGALMHETIWPVGQELLGVEWQQFPENTFPEPVITKVKQEGIKSSQPEASKKAYTPPHLRLMKEGKNPENYIPQPKVTIPGMTTGNGAANKRNSSKSNKNKSRNKKEAAVILEGPVCEVVDNANLDTTKSDESVKRQRSSNTNRRQQAKNKAANQQVVATVKENGSETEIQQQQQQQQLQQQQQPRKVVNAEKDKKIRVVAKKLSDIKKLKARQEQGETLEINQLNKISMEGKLLEELKSLKLSA